MEAFWVSLAVVFLAEIGDKSQLIAMTFATRYRWPVVLVGVAVVAGFLHYIGVVIGEWIGESFPTDLVNICAGVIFIGFAIWALMRDRSVVTKTANETKAKPEGAKSLVWSSRKEVGTVMGGYFLAEAGDKSMLATVTLATTHAGFMTWLGSTVAMVLAAGIAIAIGNLLGHRLPAEVIRIGSAVLFAVVGILLILDGLAG